PRLRPSTAPTELHTLSLHDALPICEAAEQRAEHGGMAPTQARLLDQREQGAREPERAEHGAGDVDARTPAALVDLRRNGAQDQRSESTRLNSSHVAISYAVFCLKKK